MKEAGMKAAGMKADGWITLKHGLSFESWTGSSTRRWNAEMEDAYRPIF
jgi:hypothetical protein